MRTSRPANMPKPNTRFLRHIIKDTDTHNKNLLAKEAAESRARLEDLEHAEEAKRLKTNPNARDIRRRQMGDIHAILGGKKSRTSDREDSSNRRRDDKERKSRDSDSRRQVSSRDKDLFKTHQDSRRHHGRLAEDDEENRVRRHSERSSRRRRDASTDSQRDSRRRIHSRRSRDRTRSPERRRRSRSPNDDRQRHKHRNRSPIREAARPSTSAHDGAEDSDPLDDLIGPMPAPQPRGRGAVAGSSGIEMRFSEAYDPKLDVQMDGDNGEDWDDAVEAFRDRQKLRQNQEQRLREAGFSLGEIRKAHGEDDGAERDVTWSKAGEKREWDKDKVLVGDDL